MVGAIYRRPARCTGDKAPPTIRPIAVAARWSGAISVAVILLAASWAHAQDRLQQVRNEANTPAPASSGGNGKGSSSDSSGCGDDDSGGCNFWGNITTAMFIAPFALPIALLEDKYEQPLPFTPYPYVNDYHGYQIMPPEWAKTYYSVDTSDIPRKSWAVRLSIENGNDFEGMNRVGGELKVEHESRWGIFTSWNWFRETLGNNQYDQTFIGDTNITFRFAQNEMASMYAGLGFRMLTDRLQQNYGVNVTYGGDFFPVRPIIVSFQIDGGNLGYAGVLHARGSIGAIWHGVEVFAGYDYLTIGSVNLQGPMAGMRFWF